MTSKITRPSFHHEWKTLIKCGVNKWEAIVQRNTRSLNVLDWFDTNYYLNNLYNCILDNTWGTILQPSLNEL